MSQIKSTQTTVSVVNASPSWLPAVGTIADLSLNTLKSQAPIVDGAPTSANVVLPWCGMTYAQTYGSLGSIVIYGGGHTDYPYNEVYRYDLASRLWSRIVDPTVPLFADSDNRFSDTEFGEIWADATFTKVVTGKPASTHTYGALVWAPPGSFGSDPAGYFVIPSISSPANNPNPQTSWPHYVALSNPTWQRGKSKLAKSVYEGCSLYDSSRNRIVQLGRPDWTTQAEYLQCETQSTGTITISDPGLVTYENTGGYDSESDLYMSIKRDSSQPGGFYLHLIDPKVDPKVTSNLVIQKTSSGTLPTANEPGGWEWVQAWKQWIYYPGYGNTVWRLTKPADPIRGTWSWSSFSLSGNANSFTGYPHYSRFRQVNSIPGLFVWLASNNQSVQGFRLAPPNS